VNRVQGKGGSLSSNSKSGEAGLKAKLCIRPDSAPLAARDATFLVVRLLIHRNRNALYLVAALGAIASVNNAYVVALATVKLVAALQVIGLESIVPAVTVKDVGVRRYFSFRTPTGIDGVVSAAAIDVVVDSGALDERVVMLSTVTGGAATGFGDGQCHPASKEHD
jgi:hypothetical protein